MQGWMLVDRHTHRIARSPDGVWAMYCPVRGPDNLIYYAGWWAVLTALSWNTSCPHDDLLKWR